MPTEPLTGARIPASTNSPNVPGDISNAVYDLADNTTPRFATTTARNTAYAAWIAATGGALANGMSCWTDDVNDYWDRVGGAWVARSAFGAGAGKRLVKTGTQTITNSWTVVTWDQADTVLDPGTAGMWNPGVPGDLLAPAKGIYAVTCGVENLTNIQIRRNAGGVVTNGTQVTASNGGSSGPTTAYNNAAASGFLLNAGDYVTVFGFNTTSQSAGTASGYTAFFSLTLITRMP